MACKAAPVAKAWSDQALALPGTTFLGICASPEHQKKSRCSGHNAGPACTDKGDFSDGYAHAVDTGVPNRETAMVLLDAALHGPQEGLTLYCIYDGVGYYPDWRGGGTFDASGHEHHVHKSHRAGSTFATPDFGIGQPATSGWAGVAEALRRLFSFLGALTPTVGPEVLDVQICKRKGEGGGYWMLTLTEEGPVRFPIPSERETTVLNGYKSCGGKVGQIDSQGLALYREVSTSG